MVSVKNTLSYLHYSPKPINDAYSKEVYKHYFEMVDPSKRYFLQTDMEEFSKHETKLDDYISNGDLVFFKLTTDRLLQRVDEIDVMTQNIFKSPINLDADETILLDAKKKSYAKDKNQLQAEWVKYVKYNILQEMESLEAKEKSQKELKDSLQRNKLKDTVTLKI